MEVAAPVSPRVCIVIPTLEAGATLEACLRSLDAQEYRDFEAVVVDNSGHDLTRSLGAYTFPLRRIENLDNIGFGAAINQGIAQSTSELIATLNDDCEAEPAWLARMVEAIDQESGIGSCAAQVRMSREADGVLDSAGMLIALDGTGKQRGFRRPPGEFSRDSETLCASGSASLHRRAMLAEVGGFDESFFLYCEDVDLGLRARWAGWQCWYAAQAVVYHRYSHSSGRASALKAYLVERNRLRVVIKNLPARELLMSVPAAKARYLLHLWAMLRGRGHAAEFQRGGGSAFQLAWFIVKAHLAALRDFRQLWRKRRFTKRRLGPEQFRRALRRHRVTLRKVAFE